MSKSEQKAKKGTWVEIERVLLEPGERAPNLPEDTRQCPYVLLVSGFLQNDAAIGDEARIRSVIGHQHTGTLRVISPSYGHSFGEIVPELLTIGSRERT
jgi:hypothetical protein